MGKVFTTRSRSIGGLDWEVEMGLALIRDMKLASAAGIVVFGLEQCMHAHCVTIYEGK